MIRRFVIGTVLVGLGILVLVYGEKTRLQGFKNGVQIGKTRALRQEGYSVDEIHDKIQSEEF